MLHLIHKYINCNYIILNMIYNDNSISMVILKIKNKNYEKN